MNDFVGNILQNKFYSYCYILLAGTRPKIDAHIPTWVAAVRPVTGGLSPLQNFSPPWKNMFDIL